jgi:hypothetical protein
MPPSDSHLRITLINPLGAALDHYTGSLEHVLAECGAAVSVVTLMEPSSEGQNRTRWIYEYVRSLWSVKKSRMGSSTHSVTVQVWPVVGYWDFVLLRFFFGRIPALVIFHDPHPLVRAVGYGRLARWVASRSLMRARIIVHSHVAAHAVRDGTAIHHIEILDHPMLAPEHPARRQRDGTLVRVLGQYKADRDIGGMERLAAQSPTEWAYEVIGRGWPSVGGWAVVDRFVTEDEFDQYLRASTVIVIPYLRFFQSGVAIRSLEVGTPVVGPYTSSLVDLLGEASSWLIKNDEWLPAVKAAALADPADIYRISSDAYRETLEKWRAWSDRAVTTRI